MSNIVELNDNNFDAEVIGASGVVLVKFGADYCVPCQKQSPIIEKFAEENKNIKVCEVNVDDAPLMAAKLSIRSVPTLMLFSGGKSLGFKVGLTSLADMQSFVLTKTGE